MGIGMNGKIVQRRVPSSGLITSSTNNNNNGNNNNGSNNSSSNPVSGSRIPSNRF